MPVRMLPYEPYSPDLLGPRSSEGDGKAMSEENRDPRIDPKPGDVIRREDGVVLQITGVVEDRVDWKSQAGVWVKNWHCDRGTWNQAWKQEMVHAE